MDFSAYVQRIKDAKPQAVYAFINGGGSGPLFVRAADAAGFKKAGITILAANDLIAVNELNLASNFSVDLIQVMDYTPSHPTAVNRAFVKSFGHAEPAARAGLLGRGDLRCDGRDLQSRRGAKWQPRPGQDDGTLRRA